MSWTYSGNPADSDLDAVRFCIGDTIEDDQLLQDEEINYLLSIYVSVNQSCIQGIISIMATYARFVNEEVDEVREDNSDRMAQLKILLDELKRSASAFSQIYAGGISVADKSAQEGDVDRVEPFFTRNDFDNDRRGGSDVLQNN